MSRRLVVRVTCDRCDLAIAYVPTVLKEYDFDDAGMMDAEEDSGEIPDGWQRRPVIAQVEPHDVCPDCARQP